MALISYIIASTINSYNSTINSYISTINSFIDISQQARVRWSPPLYSLTTPVRMEHATIWILG